MNAPTKPKQEFLHSTYHAKFKDKGKAHVPSPRSGSSTEVEMTSSEPVASPTASERGLLDTFSSTILNTFTPGKQAADDAKI